MEALFWLGVLVVMATTSVYLWNRKEWWEDEL